MKAGPTSTSAIGNAFGRAPCLTLARSGTLGRCCGRSLRPLLLASSSLPRWNNLGSSKLTANCGGLRRSCVRTHVIADPNDVDIDTSDHEGEALEMELARRVSSSGLQSEPLLRTSSSKDLPAYTYASNKLQMPGITVSTGMGLHGQGIDPQDPAAAAVAAAAGGSGTAVRGRRVSWDFPMQDHTSLATSSSPAASQKLQLSSSGAAAHTAQEPSRMQNSTSSEDLWGMHDRMQLEAGPSSSFSATCSSTSPASRSSERWAFDDVPYSAERAGWQAGGAAALDAPTGYASRVMTPSAVTSSQADSSGSSSSAATMSLPATDLARPLDLASTSSAAPEIPKPIMVISLISASLTLASCVFNTLLPIYMVTELKMTMRSMGMFEGLLEAFSYVVRMFSGVVSDMMTSRKSAITLGFAMGAMAKFGMSGASTVGTLFACKAIDRLANGVQAAPRDALISDLAPDNSRSACFGFAQSMRKWGSAVGAVMVYFLMKASGNNYQLIFTMAASVSLASCAAFVLLVPSHIRPQRPLEPTSGKDGASPAPSQPSGFQLSQFWKDVKGMGSDFYRMLSIIFLLGMGHINESLLEARAIEVGFGKAESTLVVATLSFVIFVVAYPLGRLDDKYGPRVTFAIGMAALIAADLVLMLSGTHPMAVFASLLFMGVHMGVLQGPLLSIVVGLAPGHLRGTAFGIFYTVMAVTALAANSIFGSVWYSFGATSAFALSAGLTTMTLLALPWLLPNRALVPAAAT